MRGFTWAGGGREEHAGLTTGLSQALSGERAIWNQRGHCADSPAPVWTRRGWGDPRQNDPEWRAGMRRVASPWLDVPLTWDEEAVWTLPGCSVPRGWVVMAGEDGKW